MLLSVVDFCLFLCVCGGLFVFLEGFFLFLSVFLCNFVGVFVSFFCFVWVLLLLLWFEIFLFVMGLTNVLRPGPVSNVLRARINTLH